MLKYASYDREIGLIPWHRLYCASETFLGQLEIGPLFAGICFSVPRYSWDALNLLNSS